MSKLILEFELVPNYLDAIRSTGTTLTDNAREWTSTDVQAKCDILQIDSSAEHEYTKHVLAREHLPIQME
eukprot:3567232-Prorocentrum_lima.AAC.1